MVQVEEQKPPGAHTPEVHWVWLLQGSPRPRPVGRLEAETQRPHCPGSAKQISLLGQVPPSPTQRVLQTPRSQASVEQSASPVHALPGVPAPGTPGTQVPAQPPSLRQ